PSIVHDICDRGKLNPRHDVFVIPGIDRLLLQIAYGMQQEYAGGLQASFAGTKEFAIMPAANVLEHADRHHTVKGLVGLAIIGVAKLDGEAGGEPPTKLDLLLRYGDAHDAHATMLGGIACEPAPPAANVEKPQSRLEFELAADQLQLVGLCRIQGLGVL